VENETLPVLRVTGNYFVFVVNKYFFVCFKIKSFYIIIFSTLRTRASFERVGKLTKGVNKIILHFKPQSSARL
jgi:hypothetical protein